MFDDFDIYGCSIGPDYEDMIWDELDCMVFCRGDCCHCCSASVCSVCEDGGLQ